MAALLKRKRPAKDDGPQQKAKRAKMQIMADDEEEVKDDPKPAPSTDSSSSSSSSSTNANTNTNTNKKDEKKDKKKKKQVVGGEMEDEKPAALDGEEEFGSELEKRFVNICSRHSQGMGQDELFAELQNPPQDELIKVINSLSSKGRLRMFQLADDQTMYQVVSKRDAAKFQGLKQEDNVVYQLIEQSKSAGIWVRELKFKSGLPVKTINKSLKTLMTRKLIKAAQSAQGKYKRVYLLYDIEPGKDVTGGPWYDGAEFDQEFFDAVYTSCLQCITHHYQESGIGVGAQKVCEVLGSAGIFTVQCTPRDIASVLVSLYFDRLVEPVPDQEAFSPNKPPTQDQLSLLYRPVRGGGVVKRSEFATIPCAVCPVADKCTPNGVINPKSCEYFKAWMEF
jgi:DNA-directed RNA polymerase III subunit RPC6